jgi:hypothetical protein
VTSVSDQTSEMDLIEVVCGLFSFLGLLFLAVVCSVYVGIAAGLASATAMVLGGVATDTSWQNVLIRLLTSLLLWASPALNVLGNIGSKILRKYSGDYITADRHTSYPWTVIGLLDTRVQLLPETAKDFPSMEPNARANADVCVMAAKLIYEDQEIFTDVVNNVWNKQESTRGRFSMTKANWVHWPASQEGGGCVAPNPTRYVDSTAALFTRKGAVVVVFRGTGPFSAINWITDIEFSLVNTRVGRVHSGFLEALGLFGARPPGVAHPPANAPPTDRNALHLLNGYLAGLDLAQKSEFRENLTRNVMDYIRGAVPAKSVLAEKPLYFNLKDQILEKINDDPTAQLFITGHSLGAAMVRSLL